jgi:hypothetical protein
MLNEVGKFEAIKALGIDDELTSELLPGFTLSLQDVFKE